MQFSNSAQQHQHDESDRKNRFLVPSRQDSTSSGSLRERAASQPPYTDSQAFLNSPTHQHTIPSSLGGSANSPWASRMHSFNTTTTARAGALPSSVPTRSSSFSNPQTNFASAMRESRFASTVEDDESEALSDTYDEHYTTPSVSAARGRSYDLTRSRSQSLAAPSRPGPIGSPFQNQAFWTDVSSLQTNPLNIPSSRYGDIKPPGSSRYGSLGTMGRSPLSNKFDSHIGGTNGYSNRQTIDPSNMSPFVRDVGQILLDDGSALRELWAGMNPPKDESAAGSGTTSRRHSVSVVQPRRPAVVGGFGNDPQDESSRSTVFHNPSFGGRGGLMLSDDDLAADLGSLSVKDSPGPSSSTRPPSQPSSLPIYAPMSRSPPSSDRVSPYKAMNLNIPSGTSFASSRQQFGSPSDSGLSAGGSPPRSQFEQQLIDAKAQYLGSGNGAASQQRSLTARFIPGQGIQYLPHGNGGATFNRSGAATMSSPLSPTSSRSIQPQQGPFYPQQIQRRTSDAPQPSINDLGKGVPLSSVPASWPLYIVEFKAGRTDLFYLTDLSLEIRVGDLVIVEADRGKDLGKVVNDTITLEEVEAFQREQKERVGYGDSGPLSPGGQQSSSVGSKKEINPKMIYGKAQPQDTQHLVTKIQDEMKALQLCQNKVRQKKLPMEVIDAEYQWDRRKLTFYFIAEKRIDFRELVRELFRCAFILVCERSLAQHARSLYKTRIWMASLQGPGGYEQ
ncbi:PSP1 C-terminal conserved region-domain-containing protein [Butyriboletus roseoflavus]|nr:PSP1 C-terminal conserved region-domain-containing protein [Butyriboletus roseoflavus]